MDLYTVVGLNYTASAINAVACTYNKVIGVLAPSSLSCNPPIVIGPIVLANVIPDLKASHD